MNENILDMTEEEYIGQQVNQLADARGSLSTKMRGNTVDRARKEYWQKRDELEDSKYVILCGQDIPSDMPEAILSRFVEEEEKRDSDKTQILHEGSFEECKEFCTSRGLEYTTSGCDDKINPDDLHGGNTGGGYSGGF